MAIRLDIGTIPIERYKEESSINSGHKGFADFLSKFEAQKETESHYKNDGNEGGKIYLRIKCGLEAEFTFRHALGFSTTIDLEVGDSFKYRKADIHELGIGIKAFKSRNKYPLISKYEKQHQVIIEMPDNLTSGYAVIHGLVYFDDIQESLGKETSKGIKANNKKKREFKDFTLIKPFNNFSDLKKLLSQHDFKKDYLELMKPFIKNNEQEQLSY